MKSNESLIYLVSLVCLCFRDRIDLISEFNPLHFNIFFCYPGSRPVATEEQLSADFRKKLTEWQRMKGVRQPPPIPARQDLSEDFLKKLG